MEEVYLEAPQVRRLCRSILQVGTVYFSGHALDKMDERDISESDVKNTLRGADRLLRVLVSQKVEPVTDYDAFERWLAGLGSDLGAKNVEPVTVCHDDGGWHAGA